jgi:diguanylate cyclase (GGDEF)-like protein
MSIFVVGATASYISAAGWIAAMGHEVSWSYVIVVAVLLQFMGLSAGVLAGGEERLRAVIAEVAVTDSLTGLPNRRRFHDAYATSLEDAVEQRVPLALMLIDVDHFKEINDEFGHPAGDDKLREVAQGLRGVLRTTDLVARYGGDEFVVVAPHATRESARALAERMRNAARECDASVSIGIAIYPEDASDQDALVSAADAALYRAKQAGRNCVWDAAAA